MTSGMKTLVSRSRDLAAAKARVRGAARAEPHTDAPYYVGYRVGDQRGRPGPNGHAQGMTGPVVLLGRRRHREDRTALVEAGGR